MEFIKKDGLKLENGGYVSNSKGEPVSNDAFISAQRRAHYLVELANATKGKDYVGKKADSFLTTVDEVVKKINTIEAIEYTETPKEPVMEIKNKLAEEALAWINFEKGTSASKRINEAMQQFNVINDFESYGLFFSPGIVKLPKIYTINDILEAVKVVEPHLESINL